MINQKFLEFLKAEAARQNLSRAELEALLMAVAGNSTKAIAESLGISTEAVRQRLSQVYHKFQIGGSGPVKLKNLLQLLINRYQQPQTQTATDPGGKSVNPRPAIDLDEAPDVSVGFYDRTPELDKLKHLIVDSGCRLVSITGMPQIGKSFLTAALANQLQDKFDSVIWRSLRNAPTAKHILTDLLTCLRAESSPIPETVEEAILQLSEYLRHHSCLLILDGVEAILQAGQLAGYYKQGYEDYGNFFRRIGEEYHQSCLILTSLENPREITLLEGETLPVRCFKLLGMQDKGARELARELTMAQQLVGEDSWQALIDRYQGHPAALKIVSKTIRELFNGNVAEFLQQETWLFGEINNLIEQLFSRLSDLEKEIIYLIAALKAVDFSTIQKSISLPQEKILETLGSLGQRTLIETNLVEGKSLFTLPPLVMEYVSKQLQPSQVQEESIELTLSSEKHVHLSAWCSNNFAFDWQPVEILYSTKPKTPDPKLRSIFPFKGEDSVKRFKQIQLGSQTVALLVTLTQETNQKFAIRVQVLPIGETAYLPANLSLSLLNDSGDILRQVQSGEQDISIQLPRIKGEPGESFSIRVALNDDSVKEDFLI